MISTKLKRIGYNPFNKKQTKGVLMKFIGNTVKNYIISLIIGILVIMMSILLAILADKYEIKLIQNFINSIDLMENFQLMVMITFAYLQGITIQKMEDNSRDVL